MIQKMFSLLIAFALLLSGCKLTFSPATQTQPEASNPSLGSTAAARTQVQAADHAPLPAAKETAAPTPTLPPTPTLEPLPLGPASYPPGVNPLTGLAVSDPEKLKLPPALVSITNFPVNARPPAGLSFTPFVFEMYIGEGATRFLALFYGEYPSQGEEGVGDDLARLPVDTIGPVRSGRLPYEPLRKQYNGFLVMASASSNVAAKLSAVSNIFGSDSGDINSAMLDATKLEQIARNEQKNLDPASLSGLLFDQLPPQGGLPAKMIWIPYSYKNQIIWRFNAESGGYDRYQDRADGKTFVQATDRLNGNALNYENVVVLFATHHAYYETLIDIDLSYINRMPALVFRDGAMHQVYWTTRNEEYEKTTGKLRPIRFIDAAGKPFPLKPGQTWVQIVPTGTPYNEVIESEIYFDLKTKKMPGSGVWAIRFYAPPIED